MEEDDENLINIVRRRTLVRQRSFIFFLEGRTLLGGRQCFEYYHQRKHKGSNCAELIVLRCSRRPVRVRLCASFTRAVNV